LLECGTKRRRGEGTRGEASWPGAGLGVEGNHGDVLFPYLYIVVIGISLGALALSR